MRKGGIPQREKFPLLFRTPDLTVISRALYQASQIDAMSYLLSHSRLIEGILKIKKIKIILN